MKSVLGADMLAEGWRYGCGLFFEG